MVHHAVIHEGLRDCDFGGDFGQDEVGVLERRDGLPERGPFLHIVDGPVEGGLSDGAAEHADGEALLGEVERQVLEAATLLTESILDRNAHVDEEQLSGVVGVLPDLVEVPAALEAVHAALDHQERNACSSI